MSIDSKALLKAVNQENLSYRQFKYVKYTKYEFEILASLRNDSRIFGNEYAAVPEISCVNAKDVSDVAGTIPGRDRWEEAVPPASPQRDVDIRTFFTRFTEGE